MPLGGGSATVFFPSSSHAVTFLYDCVQPCRFYSGLCLTLRLTAGMLSAVLVYCHAMWSCLVEVSED